MSLDTCIRGLLCLLCPRCGLWMRHVGMIIEFERRYTISRAGSHVTRHCKECHGQHASRGRHKNFACKRQLAKGCVFILHQMRTVLQLASARGACSFLQRYTMRTRLNSPYSTKPFAESAKTERQVGEEDLTDYECLRLQFQVLRASCSNRHITVDRRGCGTAQNKSLIGHQY